MSVDNTEIIGLIDEIYSVKDDLSTGDFWSNNPLREKLVSSAEKLASAARKPEEIILFQSTQVWLPIRHYKEQRPSTNDVRFVPVQSAQNFAIRTAVDLALFDRIPSSGSGISITDLSRAVKVDERLLGKLYIALIPSLCPLFFKARENAKATQPEYSAPAQAYPSSKKHGHPATSTLLCPQSSYTPLTATTSHRSTTSRVERCT